MARPAWSTSLPIDQPLPRGEELALVRALRLVNRVRLADLRACVVPVALLVGRLGVPARRMPGRLAPGVARVALVPTERERRCERAVEVPLLLGHVGVVLLLLDRLISAVDLLLAGLALTAAADVALLRCVARLR